MRTSQNKSALEQDPISPGFFVAVFVDVQDSHEGVLKCRQHISPIDLVPSMMLEIDRKSNLEE